MRLPASTAGSLIVILAACGEEPLQRRPSATQNTNTGAPGTWSSAALVEQQSSYATRPLIATDRAGNAMAVWQHQSTDYSIWASRYDGSSWSAPIVLAAGYAWIYDLDLVANGDGAAVAVWSVYDGTASVVGATHFEVASGWSTPVTVTMAAVTMVAGGTTVRAAINATGDALVGWDTSQGLWLRQYQRSGGWLDPVALVSGNISGTGTWDHAVFDLSLDPAGRALVVWAQDGVETQAVWSQRGTQAIGTTSELSFAPAEQLASYGSTRIVQQVWSGLDDAGTAYAAWSAFDGVGFGLSMTHADPGGTWNAAAEIGPIASSYGSYPNDRRVAFSRAGNGMALWREESAGRGSIIAKRYSVQAGWGADEIVADDQQPPFNCMQAVGAEVEIDDRGHAIAVWDEGWVRHDGGYATRLVASAYTPGLGWQPRVILTAPDGLVQDLATALSPGAGFAVWAAQETLPSGSWAQRIWMSRFQPSK